MVKVNKFEIPSLRVSRPVSACQRCRSAKVKCDGKLPACTACEKARRGAECSSANDGVAKGKERSYVASLETRVEKLEKQISQAKARKAAASNLLDVESAQTFLSPEIPLQAGNTRAQRKEASNIDDLVSDFGFLSVNATARDFHGFTKEMSYARLVLSTSSLEEMPRPTNNVLPQRYAIAPLIEHYLGNVHVLYPFLTETKIYGSIDAVYQGYADPMDHWITRLVLAIAYASLSRRGGDTQYQDAVRHAGSALGHIEAVIHPGSVVGIQAMVLLVLYSMLDPHHFNSWYLIGLASRAMVDIGLHQEPPPELQLKESELDLRRRIYLCVYVLDRSISMVYRRGFSFTDDSANMTPPKLREGSATTNQLFFYGLESAVQLGRLRRIQSHAYQTLFQSSRPALEDTWSFMTTSIQDVHRWWAEMPDQIDKLMKQLLHCDVLFSSILILSPSGLDGKLNEYGKFLIFDYAFEYAETMSSISQDQEKVAFYTSHDLLRTSVVAERFLGLLLQDSNLIFSGIVPNLPRDSDPWSAPPGIYSCGVGEKVNRASRCINLLERILEWLGQRFGLSSPLNEFKVNSRLVRQLIEASYANWDGSLNVSLDYAFPRAPVFGPTK